MVCTPYDVQARPTWKVEFRLCQQTFRNPQDPLLKARGLAQLSSTMVRAPSVLLCRQNSWITAASHGFPSQLVAADEDLDECFSRACPAPPFTNGAGGARIPASLLDNPERTIHVHPLTRHPCAVLSADGGTSAPFCPERSLLRCWPWPTALRMPRNSRPGTPLPETQTMFGRICNTVVIVVVCFPQLP